MPCILLTEDLVALRVSCPPTPVPCRGVPQAPIPVPMAHPALGQRAEVLPVNLLTTLASLLEIPLTWGLSWALDPLACKRVIQGFAQQCSNDSALETLSQWQEAWVVQGGLEALDLEAPEGLEVVSQGCKAIQA